ncbi:MAG TPA: BON domain-containing protein [Opitutaceae bacterium]|jgi:osmotically-inducible protein OsmY|nr:BON domain-containing protein [Opitutaceae bacterium]
MKYYNLIAALVLVASPAGLFASVETDHKIEDAARNSYNYRTVLDNEVRVSSIEGVVTLTGTVQDDQSRALAEDTVSNLPGVLGVKNDIDVKAKYPEHSDELIAVKVRGLLLVKGHVSATATTVDVADGVVSLTGTADTLAQKELTGIYANEIEYVKSVKNNITVNEKPSNSDTFGDKMDDASITSQVKYALLSHKATSAMMTKVTTTDSIVAISGQAGSSDEKALVTKLAGDVRGVKSVTNDMTVKS